MKRNSKRPSREAMVEHDTRLAINEALRTSGFDGNKRFRSITEALSVAQGVLDGFGIEVDEVLSSDKFRRSSGHLLISLAYSNRKDPFSPTSIENAGLAFSWHKFDTGRFESIAYVS